MLPTQGVLLKCNKSPRLSVTLMQRAGDADRRERRGGEGAGCECGEGMQHSGSCPSQAQRPPQEPQGMGLCTQLGPGGQGKGGFAVQAPCQIPSPYSTALLNHAPLHPAVSLFHLAVPPPPERCSPALALIHKPPHSAPPPVRQSSVLLGWHTRCPWSNPCWTPQRGLPPSSAHLTFSPLQTS